MKPNEFMTVGLSILLAPIVFVVAVYLFPLGRMQWGKLEMTPSQTVTVIGTAQSQQTNQIARFSAGVMAVNDDKQIAIDEVNQKMNTLIAAVKDFGINEADITTESLSVNLEEQYDLDTRRSTPGQWRANNSISIRLSDVSQAADLAKVLASSGATQVYGPNFMVDDTKEAEIDLVNEALQNASDKADAIAKGSGRSLGKVLSVVEGATGNPPMPYLAAQGRGGGADVSIGTSTVSQMVTVTFELK